MCATRLACSEGATAFAAEFRRSGIAPASSENAVATSAPLAICTIVVCVDVWSGFEAVCCSRSSVRAMQTRALTPVLHWASQAASNAAAGSGSGLSTLSLRQLSSHGAGTSSAASDQVQSAFAFCVQQVRYFGRMWVAWLSWSLVPLWYPTDGAMACLPASP